MKRRENLTAKELEELMVHFETIEAWMKAVRAAVLEELMRGRKSKLWKLVQGRSTRGWKDAQRVMKILIQLRIPIDSFAPRELLGVVKVEALLKKRKLAKTIKGKVRMPTYIARQVKRSEPPLHVARIDDPRPAVRRGQEFEGR